MDSRAKILQNDLFGAPPVPYAQVNARLADRLASLAKPDMVRVAPDKHAWVPADRTRPTPEFVLCRWSRTTDGAYRPIPISGRWARVTGELMANLGFESGRRYQRYETLFRLANAEFVDMVKVSPGCWMLDLDTWFRHMASCADEPGKWDDGSEDLKKYLHSNALGGWRRHVGR
jgi:hypothetical protein